MYDTCSNKEEYINIIENLKKENMKAHTSANNTRSPNNRWHWKLRYMIKHKMFLMLLRHFRKKFRQILHYKKKKEKVEISNYFSKDRIAVYTVIINGYDNLLEPKFVADNCDYYLISDGVKPPENSVWKQRNIPDSIKEELLNMNPTYVNRYLKMLPHLVFPDYDYSVYLDGNIQIITDPTEFINRLPKCGVSIHKHITRDCVYDEADAIILQKKAPEKPMKELVKFLKKEKMPRNYGMLECGVLVRDHKNPQCIQIMEDWWKMFQRFPYRDQMLLPYVLYKLGIKPDEISNLGDRLRACPSFKLYDHSEYKRK